MGSKLVITFWPQMDQALENDQFLFRPHALVWLTDYMRTFSGMTVILKPWYKCIWVCVHPTCSTLFKKINENVLALGLQSEMQHYKKQWDIPEETSWKILMLKDMHSLWPHCPSAKRQFLIKWRLEEEDKYSTYENNV